MSRVTKRRSKKSNKEIIEKVMTFSIVGLALAALLFHLIGFRWFIVISGSMSPEIPTWSLAIIDKTVNTTAITTKEIVMYETANHQTPVLHRVMEITAEGFMTKGDQNQTIDPVVPPTNIMGVYVTHIPFAGKVIYWIQQTYLLLLFGIGVIMAIMLLKSRQERSRGYEKVTSDPH